MANGIILTLDSSLDAIIRGIWQRFEQAGIGKTPGQFGEPPHITFADSSTCTSQGLVETLEDLDVEDAKLLLVPFGVFPGRESVIYTERSPLKRSLLGAREPLSGLQE